jgi:hypothetical protein
MRSKLSAITALTPSRLVPFAAQSRTSRCRIPCRRTRPGGALGLILHRGVVDRHLLAGRHVAGEAALDALDHLVLDADIGEGAAHHDFMVARREP